MFCILHYYYCVFQENELPADSDFMWVNEAARFGSLASFLQPPAFKLEILLDHTKKCLLKCFTSLSTQGPLIHPTLLPLLRLVEATETGTSDLSSS